MKRKKTFMESFKGSKLIEFTRIDMFKIFCMDRIQNFISKTFKKSQSKSNKLLKIYKKGKKKINNDLNMMQLLLKLRFAYNGVMSLLKNEQVWYIYHNQDKTINVNSEYDSSNSEEVFQLDNLISKVQKVQPESSEMVFESNVPNLLEYKERNSQSS